MSASAQTDTGQRATERHWGSCQSAVSYQLLKCRGCSAKIWECNILYKVYTQFCMKFVLVRKYFEHKKIDECHKCY